MDNQDWKEQDRHQAEVRQEQLLRIKDNTIKDLEVSNKYLHLQVDKLLKENHDLRRGIESGQIKTLPATLSPETIALLAAELDKLQQALTLLRLALTPPPKG